MGQEWTVPVFSPLRPPLNPVDILQARVESARIANVGRRDRAGVCGGLPFRFGIGFVDRFPSRSYGYAMMERY